MHATLPTFYIYVYIWARVYIPVQQCFKRSPRFPPVATSATPQSVFSCSLHILSSRRSNEKRYHFNNNLGNEEKEEGRREREKKSIFIVDNTAPISMNHFYTRT